MQSDDDMVNAVEQWLHDNSPLTNAALRAENARLTEEVMKAEEREKALREAMKGPLSWLERWAVHAGNCDGKPFCGCGLELAQHELRAALKEQPHD